MFDDLTPGEIWKIQDDIRFNRIHFYEGDTVMLFHKNKNGYPHYLKVGDIGFVKTVELEHVIVDFSPTYGMWINTSKLISPKVKLPKKLLVEKVYLRDLKLRKLLE
jgi:hypothetical protein